MRFLGTFWSVLWNPPRMPSQVDDRPPRYERWVEQAIWKFELELEADRIKRRQRGSTYPVTALANIIIGAE